MIISSMKADMCLICFMPNTTVGSSKRLMPSSNKWLLSTDHAPVNGRGTENLLSRKQSKRAYSLGEREINTFNV